MKSTNAYLDMQWISTYKSSDQTWLADSLNWEKISTAASMDWSITSFLFQSSFINQHMAVDQVFKSTYIEILLAQAVSDPLSRNTFYNAFMQDSILNTSTCYLPLSSLFQSEYQEVFSTALLVTPELASTLSEYASTYISSSSYGVSPSAVFDSYTNNLNYYPSEGSIHFMLFWIYVWFLVYYVTSVISLKWTVPVGAYFTRVYYYFFSMSKELRMQLESVLQTVLFILLYWAMVIMAFDDDQEEFIEFIDSGFFMFFSLVVGYLVYKYSIHYFAFLEASVSKDRSVGFVAKQFSKDFLNTFSLLLRFYILLFRINVYDMLDDFFDSYYIFVGDFDDDEYLNELFLSIHGTILFTLDNNDDRSFLLEDENDFASDLFYTYFVVWGKLFYFIFFTAEEGARMGLAFYICYLIIFEVHAVNCSYREDTFLNVKKSRMN